MLEQTEGGITGPQLICDMRAEIKCLLNGLAAARLYWAFAAGLPMKKGSNARGHSPFVSRRTERLWLV